MAEDALRLLDDNSRYPQRTITWTGHKRRALCICRILGTPEELLIDFGLNPQPTETLTKPIVVSQRIVTSWHTAKRLLGVLQMTVARHEAAFGVLETDVQKRIRHS